MGLAQGMGRGERVYRTLHGVGPGNGTRRAGVPDAAWGWGQSGANTIGRVQGEHTHSSIAAAASENASWLAPPLPPSASPKLLSSLASLAVAASTQAESSGSLVLAVAVAVAMAVSTAAARRTIGGRSSARVEMDCSVSAARRNL